MNIMVLAGDVATAEADTETVKARLLGTLEEDGVSAVAWTAKKTRRGGGVICSAAPPSCSDQSPGGLQTRVS